MREIAAKGGIAAHAKGRAHEFTSETAAIAGRKGGEKISRDRAHMSAIGREGGHARAGRKPSARVEPRPRRKGR
ncbi:MAG: general stress protein [Acidobacteriota bacterium]